jgi:CheY-like chemotaxis protein
MAATSPHVLVVDDDPGLRGLYSTYLSLSGLRVTEAPTGRSALERARQQHPDVVVTDIVMPEMDGAELSRQLRSDCRTRDIPIIAVSGHAHSVETAADLVIEKPCDPSQILRAIESVLGD